MKIKRKAEANWKGSGKEGKGTVTTASGVLEKSQYGYKSRFEDGKGTNPEELIGAAHAGCFSMKLAFNLQEAGAEAQNIDTEAEVILEDGAVSEIRLSTKVKAKGLDQGKFKELAEDAKKNCPISKLLNATIVFSASLEG